MFAWLDQTQAIATQLFVVRNEVRISISLMRPFALCVSAQPRIVLLAFLALAL
jgi:hypothetical protein